MRGLIILLLAVSAAVEPAGRTSGLVPASSPETQALREAISLKQEGDRLQEAERPGEAREVWRKALAAYERSGYRPGEVEILFRIGATYQVEAAFDPQKQSLWVDTMMQGLIVGVEHVRDGLPQEEPADRDAVGRGDVLFTEASKLAAAGDCQAAVPRFVHAGEIYAGAGWALGEASSMAERLRCLSKGSHPLGLAMAMGEVGALIKKLKPRLRANPRNLHLQAIAAETDGKREEAETLYRRAIESSGEDPENAARASLDLGVLLAREGNLPEARALFTSARERFASLPAEDARRNEAAAARNLESLDAGLVEAENAGEAQEKEGAAEGEGSLIAEEAPRRPPFVEMGAGAIMLLDPRAQAQREAAFALGEGDRLVQEGRLGEARKRWLVAAEGFRQAGNARGAGEAYRRLGESYAADAMFDQRKLLLASDYLNSALEAAAEVEEAESPGYGETAEKGRSLLHEAARLVAVGDCERALPMIEEAGRLLRQTDLPGGNLRAAGLKARCEAQGGDVGRSFSTMMEAMPILASLPEASPTLNVVLQAEVMLLQGRHGEARDLYQEALRRHEEAKDVEGIADTLLSLGGVQLAMDDFNAAETSLVKALGLLPALAGRGDGRYQEAVARHNLGAAYAGLVRGAEATVELRAALPLWRELGEAAREVGSLSTLGAALRAQGDYPGALAALDEAEDLQARLSPNPELEGDLHTNRALVKFSQGRFREAIAFHERALESYRRLPVRVKEAQALSNLGTVEEALGNFSKALDLFRQAKAVARQAGAVKLEVKAETNGASALAWSGEHQAAVAAYLRLLPRVQALGEPWVEATTRSNLGGILLRIGDLDGAATRFEEALKTFQEVGSKEGEATTLLNRGFVLERMGRLVEAEKDYRAALEIWTESGDAANATHAQVNLAFLASRRGGGPEAELPSLERLLTASRQAGFSRDALKLSLLIGGAHLRRGDLKAALQQAAEVIAEAERTKDIPMALVGRSLALEAYVRQRDFARASSELGHTLALVDRWQQGLTVSELKAHLLDQLSAIYILGVLVETERGRPEEAFRFAEQARARAFLDQLGNQRIAARQGVDPELVRQEGELRARISHLSESIEKEERGRPQREDFRASLETVLGEARQAYATLLLRLKLANPEYASLVSMATLSLSEVQQQVLDERTTLVEYFVPSSPPGEKNDLPVVAWVIERDRSSMVQLPVSAGDLEARVETFRRLIETGQPVQSLATDLYRDLFAPLESHVRNPHLVIIPHSVLHFLPFAALWEAERKSNLGDLYTLSYAPSATVLKFARQRQASPRPPILVAGNPDGSLLNAAKEAQAIARLYRTEPLLKSTATESAVVSRANQVGILHLAAHAELNQDNSLFTSVKLAPGGEHDGRLEMHEVYGLDLSKTGLVVLSACKTQIGKLSRGDEIEGLTRAFLYAGTPAVISSLWTVDSESTALLMERFYTHLRKDQGRAEALRNAQAETRRRFPHPYHWAAFVLTGDGR